MQYQQLTTHIAVDQNIQHGKPCIKGTRTPAYVVLEAFASGMSRDEIKREYGPLSDDDIQACLYYAALLDDEQEVVTIASGKPKIQLSDQ